MDNNKSDSRQVRVHGTTYHVKSDQPQEYLDRIAAVVDERMDEIGEACNNISSTLLAVHAAMDITDELLTLHGELDNAGKRLDVMLAGIEEELAANTPEDTTSREPS